ncbi:hypothetical protein [Yersinia pekkanenii]|uniref:Uncharacterized protein n=1 Tax=Yersinia pekkanenii TaxID=1288385 RepID=A0A0T9PD55_9GAMM|nr:hypothetical protein [Yersinia pekkanenii]CNH58830.1 Uncharacterised protein [Yersinia pekkanenii]CRY66392.1 Uncharacterised protein [Yersinia pekkanenii]
MSQQLESVEGLALYLGEIRVGVLVHYDEGRDPHKHVLRNHWAQLHTDFRL